MAYSGAELFIRGLRQAGPNADATAVSRAMEGTRSTRDFFGNPDFTLSAPDHLANRRVRVAQIRNGRWENLTDYLPAQR